MAAEVVGKRKKLLFVIDSFNIGGAERSLCTLLNLLPDKIYDIDVLITARGGALEKYLPANVNLALIPHHGKGVAGRLKYAFNHLRHALITRMVRGRKPSNPAERFWRLLGCMAVAPSETYDVAIAYHQGFPTYYVATKVRANRKIAWINADIVKESYTETFNLKFYSIYNKVVTASPLLRDIMLDAWDLREEKLVAICDIVSPVMLKRQADEFEAYPKSEQDAGRLQILTVGRLVGVKGIDILIESAALLKGRGVNFRWDVIGDGPLREQLQEQIRQSGLTDHVRLLGAKDNPYPWIKECDVYVQPSRSEGYGIAVCEAKAFHKPIIVTNFKVASGLIGHGYNGLITDMNAGALAKAVERMTDHKLREKFTEALAGGKTDNAAESLSLITRLLS